MNTPATTALADPDVPPFCAHLRDFTADPRMLMLSALGLVLGVAGALLAYFLLHLIYGATNLFYFHRLSWQFVSPAANSGETLRTVAERMASAHVTAMRVLQTGTGKAVGFINLENMLHARVRSYNRETKQERVRQLRLPFQRSRVQEPQQRSESVLD